MNPRLRLAFILLAALCAANLGWRVWEGWGRITIRANDTPVADVVRSIEKQAGVKLHSNLPADTKVTMHVLKASLPHTLEVLAANTESSWSVAYFTAPDKGSIATALASLGSGGRNVEGWRRFGFRGGPGGGDDFGGGISDPRTDPWEPKPAEQATLHGYLEQAAIVTTAQFWAPENWNPAVPKPPKADEISDVMPKLAKMARGQTAEVFLLRGRPQGRDFAEGGEREERPRGGDGGGERRRDRMPSESMRQAMEDRARAQIEKLPKDQRAAALAEFEERRKFFAELSQLPPEERRAKMQERMEQAMNNSEMAERMESGSLRRGAMQTAEGRADRYRAYLDRKRQSSN